MANKNLHNAKSAKNDEFYTQLVDIEREMKYYKQQFHWKTIFCNCDDPEESHFFKYFLLNFEHLWIKKLISTHFDSTEKTYKLEIIKDKNNDGKINNLDIIKTPLQQNGDFRSPECIEMLKEADIVITNPPFSLFREYVAQLMEYQKKFLIIGNMNAMKYKEIFKLIKEDKIWLWYGFNQSMVFKTPYKNILPANVKFCKQKGYEGDNYIKTPAINRYTNLETKKRHENLILYKKYSSEEYPTYDNYDAIEVSKVSDIPIDYKWLMWVPITFLGVYNPEQFEIIDGLNRYSILSWPTPETKGKYLQAVNWQPKFARIVIKYKL